MDSIPKAAIIALNICIVIGVKSCHLYINKPNHSAIITHPKPAPSTFDSLDTDGDNVLRRWEFLYAPSFNNLDVDQNEAITRDEVPEGATFASLDLNRDGTITRDEVIEFRKSHPLLDSEKNND